MFEEMCVSFGKFTHILRKMLGKKIMLQENIAVGGYIPV